MNWDGGIDFVGVFYVWIIWTMDDREPEDDERTISDLNNLNLYFIKYKIQ